MSWIAFERGIGKVEELLGQTFPGGRMDYDGAETQCTRGDIRCRSEASSSLEGRGRGDLGWYSTDSSFARDWNAACRRRPCSRFAGAVDSRQRNTQICRSTSSVRYTGDGSRGRTVGVECAKRFRKLRAAPRF